MPRRPPPISTSAARPRHQPLSDSSPTAPESNAVSTAAQPAATPSAHLQRSSSHPAIQQALAQHAATQAQPALGWKDLPPELVQGILGALPKGMASANNNPDQIAKQILQLKLVDHATADLVVQLLQQDQHAATARKIMEKTLTSMVTDGTHYPTEAAFEAAIRKTLEGKPHVGIDLEKMCDTSSLSIRAAPGQPVLDFDDVNSRCRMLLKVLSEQTGLRTLDIDAKEFPERSALSADLIDALMKMQQNNPDIEHFHLDASNNYSSRQNDLPLTSFTGLTSLTSLKARHHTLPDDGVPSLGALVNLVSLDVSTLHGCSRQAMESLRSLTKLETFKFSTPAFSSDGAEALMGALKEMPSLTALNLTSSYLGLDGSMIHHLPSLPNLNTFAAGDCLLGDQGMAIVAERLPNLTALDVQGNGLSAASLTKIATTWPDLTRLNLAMNRLESGGIQALSNLKHLQGLDLSYIEVGDADINALFGLSSSFSKLARLGLSGNGLTDACIPALSKLTGLKRLEVEQGAGLSNAAIAELQSKLPDMQLHKFLQHGLFKI